MQGLYALSSGGWFGVGLGASRQKWDYLPNANTDYIFAIIGEELGLMGTLLVLGLFATLAYAGIRVARRAPDPFARLACGRRDHLAGRPGADQHRRRGGAAAHHRASRCR